MRRTRALWLLSVLGVCGLLAAGLRGTVLTWVLGRANLKLAYGDTSGAERHLSMADWLSHSSPDVSLCHARLARKLGLVDLVVARLKDAAEYGGSADKIQLEAILADAEAGRLQRLEERLPSLLEAGTDVHEVCEAFVRGCLMNYRLNDAMQLIEVWSADFPQSPMPYLFRGRILEHRDNLVGAAEEYRHALEVAPEFGPAAFALGRVLVAQNQFEPALAVYETAGRTLHDPQPALIGQARCLRELQHLDEARHRLELASQSDPARVAAAYRLLGEPLESLGSQLQAEQGELALAAGDPVEAEQSFRHALQANPRAWRLRFSLAKALRDQQRNADADAELVRYQEASEAVATFDKLLDQLQRRPDDVETRFQVAQVLTNYLSENQGIIWLNTVLDYDPDHRPAHTLLAEIYEKRVQQDSRFEPKAAQHRAALQRLETDTGLRTEDTP